MKMLKKGRGLDWVYDVVNTCDRCGCEWNITRDDTRLSSGEFLHTLFTGMPKDSWFVNKDYTVITSRCPSCGKQVATDSDGTIHRLKAKMAAIRE